MATHYNSLVESLRLLSSSFKEQESYLPDFVIVQDEVVAIFSDAFLTLPQLIENNLLSNDSIASIIRCYNFMEMALRNQKNSESFKNQEDWIKVRKLAILTLQKMGEEVTEPDLSFVNWVD